MKPSSGAGPGRSQAVARTAFNTLSLIAAVGCAATTAAYFWDDHALLAQLSPFRLQYAALLFGHLLFCLLMRRWRAAFAFGFFAAANLFAVLPEGSPGPKDTPASPTRSALKIVYANVLTENTDPAPLLALIARESPDLVAVVEVNARWDIDLRQALRETHPHRFAQPSEDNFGLALYSRLPLSDQSVEYLASPDFASLAATLQTSAGDVRLLLTHPPPPGDTAHTRIRNRQIMGIADWLPPITEDASSVILGDFNATPWCPPLAELRGRARLELASTRHSLYPATWPARVPQLRIPLDHVLTRGRLRTLDFRVGPDIGSDHFPLIVDLGLSPIAP